MHQSPVAELSSNVPLAPLNHPSLHPKRAPEVLAGVMATETQLHGVRA